MLFKSFINVNPNANRHLFMQAGQAMKFASYVYDYNYEPKSGPKPERYFGGMFTGLNTHVWKITEEQGTKDWFLLRRFMLTSTSAVHCLRKIETPWLMYRLI